MGKEEEEPTTEELLVLLKSDDIDVKWKAVEALGVLGDVRAVRLIFEEIIESELNYFDDIMDVLSIEYFSIFISTGGIIHV